MCVRVRQGVRDREGECAIERERERETEMACACVASCLSFMVARSRFQLPPHAGQLICISLICTLTRSAEVRGRQRHKVKQRERESESDDRDSAWARSFRNICLGLLSVINVAVIENYFHFYVYHYQRPLQLPLQLASGNGQRATSNTTMQQQTGSRQANEAWVLA